MLPVTEIAAFLGGFVAAEGTFYRSGNRFRFAISLGARDSEMCEMAAALFGVGTVSKWPRRKPHYDDEVRFSVARIDDHLRAVVPFMDEFLPLSLKREQYLHWRAELLEFWQKHARRRRPCTVDGCDIAQRGKGVCRKHYYALYGK